MPGHRSRSTILEDEFLLVRAKILEIAASLDRLDRGAGEIDPSDPRPSQIRAAMETLLASDVHRAERIQLIFSRAYVDSWRIEFGLGK